MSVGKSHFIGTICYKTDNSKTRQLVDGQQRVTSLSLLAAAIRDQDDTVKAEIDDLYLKNRFVDTELARLKLRLNKYDNEVYRILMDHGPSACEKLTERQMLSRVYRNYVEFYDMVGTYISDGGTGRELLRGMSLLTLVELEIEQENPQEIFESLNSTGLDLTPVDLLRNYLLMRFSHEFQTKLYEAYWCEIEYAVGSENMLLFFTDYIRTKMMTHVVYGFDGRKKMPISEKKLQFFFKYYYDGLDGFDSEEDRAEAVFADMARYAKLYKVLLFDDDAAPESMDAVRRAAWFLVVVNECSSARVLLLYLLDLMDRGFILGDQMAEALDAATSFVFRSRVCKHQGLRAQFVTSILFRLKGLKDYSDFTDVFWRAITSGEKSFEFPSDELFKSELTSKDLYINTLRAAGLKYMLYMLDAKSGYGKGMPTYNDETITVDHIMPQTPTAAWFSTMDEITKSRHGELKHRLGNMALTSQNSEMSNKLFDERREFYRNAKFHYTQVLADRPDWQAGDIDARGMMLAERACAVWPLPAQYRKGAVLSGRDYTLMDDADQFTSKKLLSVEIDGELIDVAAWSGLLSAVAKYLNSEDPSSMVEAVRTVGKAVAVFDADGALAAENKYLVRADEDLYVRGHQSTKDALRYVQRLVRAFDDVSGSDHMNDIRFRIR